MKQALATGFFGKLPAHGDFIHRGLPSQCVNIWDDWLQAVIGSTQEQLGEHWLDVYLTSPIWRFALSPGVIDGRLWAGISLPSVDRVGRYFPFTVLGAAASDVPATVVMSEADEWYESLETIALAALDGRVQMEQMAAQIERLPLPVNAAYQRLPSGQGSGRVVALGDEQAGPDSVYPYLLDSALAQAMPSYSIWSTKGSDRVEPCVATAPGLPAVAGIAAMYTGQWLDWQWSQPFAPSSRSEQNA